MLLRILTLIVIVSQSGSNPIPNDEVQISEGVLERKLAETEFRLDGGMNEFAGRLFQRLNGIENGNVVFSPFSLYSTLAMVYFGSPEQSQTHKELTDLLGLNYEFLADYPINFLQMFQRFDNVGKNSSTEIRYANKIFADDDIETSAKFSALLRYFFRTDMDVIDFANETQSVNLINNYVAAKTNGKIRNLIENIDTMTRLILINAVYFKGNWKFRFDEDKTKPARFSVESGTSYIYNDTMFMESVLGVAEIPEIRSKILELPYEDADFRLLVILPDESEDLGFLEENLSNFNLNDLDWKLTFEKTKVQIPKFKIKVKTDFIPHLKSLGLESVFNPALADLSDMIDTEEDLWVTGVEHVAEVDVNESGTEAVAATAVQIHTRLVQEKPKNVREFIADRPFMFVIQDRFLGLPLFQGRIVDPEGIRTLNKTEKEVALEPFVAKIVNEDVEEDFGEENSSSGSDECDENGFQTVDSPHISFPCKNKDRTNN